MGSAALLPDRACGEELAPRLRGAKKLPIMHATLIAEVSDSGAATEWSDIDPHFYHYASGCSDMYVDVGRMVIAMNRLDAAAYG